MDHFDKIEAYYEGTLSEAEKLELLNQIEADPKLKSEFEIQGEMIEGIKAYRKAELMAKLDAVQITPATQHLFAKLFGGAVLATALGVGAYFYFQPNEDSSKKDAEQTEIATPPQAIKAIDNATPSTNTEINVSPQEAEKSIRREVENSNSEKTKQPAEPTIKVPEVVDHFEDSQLVEEESVSAPKNSSSFEVNSRKDMDVSVKISKKYNFHYQLIENKLVLYGAFEDEPFEILELNMSENIRLYLYYKNDFYAIESGSEEIKPLIRVKDQELLKRLSSLR